MGESTAARLLEKIRQSNLNSDTQVELTDALSYAVRYGRMVDVLIDTPVQDGNRDVLEELWQATNFTFQGGYIVR
jgi:hypothetical protein